MRYLAEVNELFDLVKSYNDAYRTGDPIVTDAEYDFTLNLLKEKAPNHPWFSAIEPTPIPEDRKEKLPIDMRSLNKVKSFADLQKWIAKTSNYLGFENQCTLLFTITPKLDGISLLVDEINRHAWTRGSDDNVGMRSDALIALANAPRRLISQFTGGELILSREKWEGHFMGCINPRTGEEYKTIRGVAAGLASQDVPNKRARYLDYLPYYILGKDTGNVSYSSDLHQFTLFPGPHVDYATVYSDEFTTELLDELYTKWNNDYEIDGLVITVDNKTHWDTLGKQTSTGNPNYAIAYKADFEERFHTKVRKINCKVSKNGYLRPTVEIDPVKIMGCSVENPTGNNMKHVIDNNIAPGSEIVVIRSGSVIPKIVQTISFNEEEVHGVLDDFAECPSCGGPTVWNPSHTDLVCTNSQCPGRMLAKIVHFFTIFKFEDFGESTISAIFDEGYTTVGQILSISFNELIAIEGIGASTAASIRKQIDALYDYQNPVAITRLMAASDCFEGIGESKSKNIIDAIDESLYPAIIDGRITLEMFREQLTGVKGIGEKTLDAFLRGWYEFQMLNRELWMIPYAVGQSNKVLSNELENIAVCFTGVRDTNLEELIKSKGGKISSGVTKKTTHLVTDRVDSKSSKAVKARELGIPILTLESAQEIWK